MTNTRTPEAACTAYTCDECERLFPAYSPIRDTDVADDDVLCLECRSRLTVERAAEFASIDAEERIAALLDPKE